MLGSHKAAWGVRLDSSNHSKNGCRTGASSTRPENIAGAMDRHADEKSRKETDRNMKNSVKSLLVAAAVTGLLGATVVPVAMADDKAASTAQTEQKDKDKHSCKGANGCSGKEAKTTKDTKDAKAKKASTKDSKEAASKDKNSCKGANGCSGKEEKKN
jgi:hypothetical protein